MIDVTDVAINEQKKEVIITGIDVDKMWEHHEGEAKSAPCKEAAYKFDISVPGIRKYLYLATKNNKQADKFPYMNERLKAFVGQTIYLSENFLIKENARKGKEVKA